MKLTTKEELYIRKTYTSPIYENKGQFSLSAQFEGSWKVTILTTNDKKNYTEITSTKEKDGIGFDSTTCIYRYIKVKIEKLVRSGTKTRVPKIRFVTKEY